MHVGSLHLAAVFFLEGGNSPQLQTVFVVFVVTCHVIVSLVGLCFAFGLFWLLGLQVSIWKGISGHQATVQGM